MNSTYCLIFGIVATMLAACSSSQREAIRQTSRQGPADSAQKAMNYQEVESPSPRVDQLANAREWSPKFIATGSASGIMVEFTGLKKDAELRARYAGIELRPVVQDSGVTHLPASITLSTTINGLRQAFFKVRPGKYLVRQSKDCAEKSYIRDIVVKEGSYSIVSFGVLNPRAPKTKELFDTIERVFLHTPPKERRENDPGAKVH